MVLLSTGEGKDSDMELDWHSETMAERDQPPWTEHIHDTSIHDHEGGNLPHTHLDGVFGPGLPSASTETLAQAEYADEGFTQPKPACLVRIVDSGPGVMIVESDCDGPMADGRMFHNYNDAKEFAHWQGWTVDERWGNTQVVL